MKGFRVSKGCAESLLPVKVCSHIWRSWTADCDRGDANIVIGTAIAVKECASRGHSLGLESCVPWPLICGDPYASLDCQLPKHKSRAPHPHNPPFGQKDGSSSHSMTGKSLRNICYQDPHHSLVSLHDNNPLEQWERDIVPYIELAHKAMSRHFKCLKNSVVMQFKKNYELLSEKDAGTPGLTEEETPRLKMLDKILRQ
ncbi:hypothetical protein FXO38_00755 [Capsicum annuum]|nr:hypothetical protein FXO38_00755 [Capsicum annuum]